MESTLDPTQLTADLVRGALELERTERGLLPHRLPAHARAQIPDEMLANAESQPSGVRVVFRSRATVVELDALRTRTTYVGAPDRPDGIYDLRVDGELVDQASVDGGNVIELDWTDGSARTRPGPVGTVRFAGLPERDKTVELWLPWDETTELVGLRTDAPVEAVAPGGRRVWLHHGSSISQGSIASSPSTTWAAIAAARGDVDLVNLGFAGSALLDPFTARAMRDTAADLISVKIGINLVNHDLIRLRGFGPAVHGFLDTIRDGHPDTPLLVVSPLLCPIQEDTPGPGTFDTDALAEGIVRFMATGDPAETAAGKLTLTVIRRELARIVEERSATDPAISYLDGLTLYGEADHDELPLPDNLHPDAATHRRIGERFADAAFAEGGPFSAGG
jgi:GDSL-like lipase/acylhydrolase family protein/salicyl acyltransferaes SsfX3-like protein